MNKLVVALLVCALSLVGAGVATAGQITSEFLSAGSQSVTATWSTGSYTGSAGAFHIVVTDPTGLESLPTQFDTFCVDLANSMVTPATAILDTISNWDHAATTTAGKMAAAWLLNNFFANGSGAYGPAAYQIAIWEALYETSGVFNVTTGNATFVTLSAGPDANTLLGLAAGNTVDAGWLRTNVDLNNNGQDFGAPLSVPDGGATLMLLGGALMGLGAMRRKFRG